MLRKITLLVAVFTLAPVLATPYQARLRNDDRVITCYTCQGIILEGFDIAHSGPGAAPLVIHIQDLIDGTDFVRRVTLRDNVIPRQLRQRPGEDQQRVVVEQVAGDGDLPGRSSGMRVTRSGWGRPRSHGVSWSS